MRRRRIRRFALSISGSRRSAAAVRVSSSSRLSLRTTRNVESARLQGQMPGSLAQGGRSYPPRAVDQPVDAGKGGRSLLSATSPGLAALLRGIGEVMPRDAVLSLEGRRSVAPDVVAFLRVKRGACRRRSRPNTVGPNRRVLPPAADRHDLGDLRDLAERHAAPEVRQTTYVVYPGAPDPHEAGDAGGRYIAVSRQLPEATIRAFRRGARGCPASGGLLSRGPAARRGSFRNTAQASDLSPAEHRTWRDGRRRVRSELKIEAQAT